MTTRSGRGTADDRPRAEGSGDRLGDDYFHDTWTDPDPWGFEHRWYERRKRDLTMAVLPDEHYRHGVEPGCAQGLLTRRLAERCERLTALELVPAVAARARRRCADLGHVDVRVGALPDDWPPRDRGDGPPVDLVVASEVLYYLQPAGLDRVLSGLERVLESEGVLVAVHWRGPTDYPLTGDEVHRRLDAVSWLAPAVHLVQEDLRLDVWTRR